MYSHYPQILKLCKKYAVGEISQEDLVYELAFNTFDESEGDNPIAQEARDLWSILQTRNSEVREAKKNGFNEISTHLKFI